MGIMIIFEDDKPCRDRKPLQKRTIHPGRAEDYPVYHAVAQQICRSILAQAAQAEPEKGQA